MKIPNEDNEQGGPNLTPVIDVVFLLLIFFLVATTFDEQEREMAIALPEVIASQPLSQTEDLIINITDEGKYKIVTKLYTKYQVDRILQQLGATNPHKKVLIRADGRVDWRFVADLAARCDKYKIEHKESVLKDKS